jgi:hypothetical protein
LTRCRALRWIDRSMVAGSVAGTLGWMMFSVVSGPLAVYYPLWLGVAGTLIWRSRARLSARLRAWQAPPWRRFLLLGFGAVLTEEVIVALANHLTEHLSPLLYLVRVGQFWMLNLFTFFGFIAGWCLLLRYWRFSNREVFYLAGCWGLFAEKIIFALPAQPLFFLCTAPPTILTYGLIITPALLSQPAGDRWRLNALARYPLTYALLFVLSVPPILVLGALRARLPVLFPPIFMVPP